MLPAFDASDLWLLVAAGAVMGFGGFIKGAVGFALPMVALAGLGLFLTAQEAIVVLLIPTAISNLWQSLRQGWAAAKATFLAFWRLNAAMAAVMAVSAQLVPHIASATLFLLLGAVVTMAAALQLAGWQPRGLGAETGGQRPVIQITVGIVAGLIGGVTAVWGPVVLFYLIALGTDKQTQVRMLGLNFTIGWWVLLSAHLNSGILNAQTLPLSAAMLVPVLAGMALGMQVQDRLNPSVFRRVTLVVLCVAGLNLLRRGLA
ncbi:MAG: sulfite exporter TauE/SafE family protein [Pseudomonadota bacterium]